MPPVVAPALPPLKRRRAGSCSVPARFPSGSFSYKAGRKTVPPLLIARRCPRSPPPLRFRFVRPAGFRWSVSRFRFRLPGSGNRKPGAAFPETAPKPLSFPRPPLLAKTRAGLVSLWAVPCGSLAGGLLFLRVPGFLCVRPPGAPYAAGSGVALPAKKIKAGRRLVRFFSPARGLTKFIQSVIIWLWLIPANPIAFAEQEEYNYIIPELQKIRFYNAINGGALVGIRHEGFFTIRLWLPGAGTAIAESPVKFEHAHAVEVFRLGIDPGNVNR